MLADVEPIRDEELFGAYLRGIETIVCLFQVFHFCVRLEPTYEGLKPRCAWEVRSAPSSVWSLPTRD